METLEESKDHALTAPLEVDFDKVEAAQKESQPINDGKMTPRLMFAVVMVSLGSSLQFGYGTGVMNNSEQFVRDSFRNAGKSYTVQQWAATVSMFGWGGLLGAVLGSKILSHWMGRKPIMALGSLIIFISSGLQSFGPQWYYLCAGRFFVGMVAGIATGVVPTYLSEISPIRLRGGIGTAHQLGITLGILLAEALSTPSLHMLGSNELWPWLFAPPSILGFMLLVALPFIPESPAYLFVRQGDAAARTALEKLRGHGPEAQEQVETSLDLIRQEAAMHAQEESSGATSVLKLIRDRTLRKQLVVGVVIQLMMQLSGIDAVFYYSTSVFQMAGVKDPQLATTFLGIINVLVTLWAIRKMDVAGRRTLLMWSWSGMFTSYVILTTALVVLAWHGEIRAWEHVSVAAMVGVIIFFAFGPGCIAWLIIAEIFPLHARESAMSIGMGINWFANWAVAFSFPQILQGIKEWAFLLFVATTGYFFFFTYKFVPETKNRTVPEITKIFDEMHIPFIGAAPATKASDADEPAARY